MEFLNEKTVEHSLAVLIVFNIAATAALQILDALQKPLNEDHFLYKAISAVKKAIDLLSANRKHK